MPIPTTPSYVALSNLFVNVNAPANAFTLTIGSNTYHLWEAAPGYGVWAAADTWLSTDSYPSFFTNQNILDQINLCAGNPEAVTGRFVCFAAPNGNLNYTAGDANAPLYDPIWTVPLWCLDYYQRTGDITPFTTYKTAILAQFQTVPLNPTTGLVACVFAVTTHPWGFQDAVQHDGDNALGSVFAWKTALVIAQLCTITGDSTNATLYTAIAAKIAANFSELYDAVSGMFFSDSTGANATNLDIPASTLAVYWGLTTTPQTTSVGTYLATNWSTICNVDGYVYQSPTLWGASRAGGQPYGPGTYDDGSWTYHFMWVVYALSKVSPKLAVAIVYRVAFGEDPTQEWIPRTGIISTDSKVNNLCSTAQGVGAAAIAAGLTSVKPSDFNLTDTFTGTASTTLDAHTPDHGLLPWGGGFKVNSANSFLLTGDGYLFNAHSPGSLYIYPVPFDGDHLQITAKWRFVATLAGGSDFVGVSFYDNCYNGVPVSRFGFRSDSGWSLYNGGSGTPAFTSAYAFPTAGTIVYGRFTMTPSGTNIALLYEVSYDSGVTYSTLFGGAKTVARSSIGPPGVGFWTDSEIMSAATGVQMGALNVTNLDPDPPPPPAIGTGGQLPLSSTFDLTLSM